MKSFIHHSAKTVDEAVKLLKNYKGKAKLIAGGTDLLGTLKDTILPDYPEAIVNIKTVPGLDYIKEDSEGIKIGALAKLADIANSPMVKRKYELLAEAAEAVATPQIRNMGTIGGNLCQDLRCWYYRYPHDIGGRFVCHMKGGKGCYALTGENQYHSIFGASRADHPSCSSKCPGAVDIPSYLSKIREGDLRGAAKLLLTANPIPSITGRLCPHFCEQECNRGEFDESVSIRDIERFMGDYVLENGNEMIKPPKVDTGKSVAIVGAGPAGLSAAYYLRMSGNRVTVFDRMEEAGGMLAYGVPAYRLSKDLVGRVVKKMIGDTGVEFRLKVDVGKDVTMQDLKKDFDSIFLASGAWRQSSIGLEGEKLTTPGLEFLIHVNLGQKVEVGERVAVIGGGNVAIDAARTALRIGAKEVTIIYRRSRNEMPANEEEIKEADEEGIKFQFLASPTEIISKDGEVTSLRCIRTELGEPDASGRRRPIPIQGSDFSVEVDMIIPALGQTPDLSYFDPPWLLKVDRGLIVIDQKTQETNIPGLFAGGEITSGPATVIEAIAAGKRAAVAIDGYLQGAGIKAQDLDEESDRTFLKFNIEYLKKTSRAEMPKRPISERNMEVEDTLGLSLREIETEANRCFNCGCVAVNSSDIAAALVALDAKIKIEGSSGFRIIPIDDFFGSVGNILAPDEIVTEIEVPQPPDKAKQAFLKFRSRKSIDFPIVSVASIITSSDGVYENVRIVLGGVSQRPIRATGAEQAIKGKVMEAGTAEAAAELAVAGAVPLRMNSSKIKITKALVKRSLLS